ncbi:MAG: hypothetical protein ACRC6I_18750 [Paracoccaceae bacterium]
MRIEGLLVLATPFAVYFALTLLPTRIGYRWTGIASAILSVGLVVAVFQRPTEGRFDIAPYFASIATAIVLAVVGGANAYHAIARRRGPSWAMRMICLIGASLICWIFYLAYHEFYRWAY